MAKQPKRPTLAQKKAAASQAPSDPIAEIRDMSDTGAQKFTRLFVYGTLRSGMRLNPILRNSTFVDMALTFPEYRMFSNGSYPYLVVRQMVPDLIGKVIVGEVWDVDDKALMELMHIEGEYSLATIQLQNRNDEVKAFMIDADSWIGRHYSTRFPNFLRDLDECTDFVEYMAAGKGLAARNKR